MDRQTDGLTNGRTKRDVESRSTRLKTQIIPDNAVTDCKRNSDGDKIRVAGGVILPMSPRERRLSLLFRVVCVEMLRC